MKLSNFTGGEPASVRQRAGNNVSKYFSDERIWFEPARKIGALNDKELLMIKGESLELTQLRLKLRRPIHQRAEKYALLLGIASHLMNRGRMRR